MSYYELCVLKELVLKGYEPKSIIEKRLIDKQFRKELIKKYSIVTINAIEQCISDKTRIQSDKDYKIYREREYDTRFIYPDEVIMEEHFKEYGYLQETRLIEYIYYNKTIKDIYRLKHLELMEDYKIYSMEYPLSFSELVFPAKMPTKDYFPFVDFDIGTKIPLPLTKEEKERYKDDLADSLNPNIYEWEIEDTDWGYCILWIDQYRVYMNLDCINYYFKQVGKNVHLFELRFQCV